MLRRFLPCLALVLLLPSMAFGYDLTGQWEASILGSRVTAEFTQNGQMFTGVMRVPEPGGKINVYHLAGAIFDAKFVALHGSGHVFEGVMTSKDEARGEFKIAGGPVLDVRLHRLGKAAN